MAMEPVQGVAVWAHTGRGLRLEEAQRLAVLDRWRHALAPPRLVIAAAGTTPGLADHGQVIMAATSMARQAFDGGADALLVHPPVAFRKHADQDTLILDYHVAIAEAGLPLILFYLYEDAGGLRYGADLLRRLLAMPRVLGIKVATLDSVMTFQDIASLVATAAPEKSRALEGSPGTPGRGIPETESRRR
jgi:4-hydroxy-tetrahydrodipicolinate synthase